MTKPLIPGGYVIVPRQITTDELFSKPPLYLKVWIYLLTRAQHGDYKELKRGQLYTSIPEIMEGCAWRVGFRTVKPTKDEVYQVIDWLRKLDESNDESNAKATTITTTKATHGYLVTIDNYGLFQNPKSYESNDEGNDDSVTKPTREQLLPDNINKNDNNNKNYKNEKDKKHYIAFPCDAHEFLEIYNSHYRDKFGKDHPRVTQEQVDDILERIGDIESHGIESEEFAEAVEQHFESLPKKNDGKIFSFLQASFRWFEVRNGDQF